jgi:hypothetical protein
MDAAGADVMSVLLLAYAWIVVVDQPRPWWMYAYCGLASVALLALRLPAGDES